MKSIRMKKSLGMVAALSGLLFLGACGGAAEESKSTDEKVVKP
ncbi:hypothetical protein [Priestia flexa]|jgi:ferric citrate transport system substrate-binding protein|nr:MULTISPECIES: hypothetical protein [Bacteria]UZW65581.1 hypothetical protein OC195_15980 [Priestia flexa]